MTADLWNWIFMPIASAATVFAAFRYVHMLQLESYQSNMYLKWLKRAGFKAYLPFLLTGFLPLLLRVLRAVWPPVLPTSINFLLLYGSDTVYILSLFLIAVFNKRRPAKKSFILTGRVKRLLLLLFTLSTLFHINLFLPFTPPGWDGVLGINTLHYMPGLLLPMFILFAHIMILPVENCVKRWYYNDAVRKLSGRDTLTKIGIVGSYGKTSTKFILGTILQEKWNTLVTPSSYNTPMGITRVVREQLSAEHEVFVAEMGERYKGDIAELCNLVKPHYGIITAVGKQHLDTFGSYESIIDTISEILYELPPHGAVFINGENPDCRRMYDTCMLDNKFFFGLEGEGLYLKAVDINVGNSGSSFTLVAGDGESVRCKTVLLGKHNIVNITGAAALAKYLGVSMKQIAMAIKKIKPIEHRLQLIQGSVTVIDDTYNSNPAGAKAALDVLKEFAPPRRIIVTPGMVELGEEEDILNESFGRDIANAADIAILVGGRRVEPIRRGLINEGFPEDCIVVVDSLTEVASILPLYAMPGSVVLFENDLPDNY